MKSKLLSFIIGVLLLGLGLILLSSDRSISGIMESIGGFISRMLDL